MVSLLVTGTMGDKSEWSIGEASPSNNKNSYPYAMAEKRAKDRVILKLVGLHGDVYAEDEADAFKEARPQEIKGGTIDNGSEEVTEEKRKPSRQPLIDVKDIESDKVETVPADQGINIIKDVFKTFMPNDDIDKLRRFKDVNKEALTHLKEFDETAYQEVKDLFMAKAEELKTKAKGEVNE